MPDVHDATTRSRNMAAIKRENTKPELLIRRGLHALGMRYRLHGKDLAGSPDVVFPKYEAVLFVHGCFWHMHSCPLFVWPKTRREFWEKKLRGNALRDAKAVSQLRKDGWRVGVVWECSIKGRHKKDLQLTINEISNWLRSNRSQIEIAGDYSDQISK